VRLRPRTIIHCTDNRVALSRSVIRLGIRSKSSTTFSDDRRSLAFMTRRLTISGSRSEMGLLEDPAEPETPPPSWSPAKQEFWRKPSKWQICMPRLRLVAKVLASFIALVLFIKIMGSKPPPPPPTPPPEPPTVLTEQQLMEKTMEDAKKEDWVWKDFPTYVKHHATIRRPM
jgi:hypothetical protein